MVGALADWFAVTALFRHPLGIPIPHTAIIPRRKDQIGRSLGEFVEGNFLTQDVLIQRLESVEIGRRLGHWLAQPTSARRASAASWTRCAAPSKCSTTATCRKRSAGSSSAGCGRRTWHRCSARRSTCRSRAATSSACSTPCSSGSGTFLEGERGDVAHSTQEGVAVVGARADRRPHLQEDPRWRAELPRRPPRRAGARGAGGHRAAGPRARRAIAHRSGDDRQGRGAEARVALPPGGAGVAAVAVGRAEAGDVDGRRRSRQRATPPARRRAGAARAPPPRRCRAAGQGRRVGRAGGGLPRSSTTAARSPTSSPRRSSAGTAATRPAASSCRSAATSSSSASTAPSSAVSPA